MAIGGVMRWAATAFQIVGVFALSSRAVPPVAAFCVMSVGSTLWLLGAWRGREWPAVALNAAFTLSNAVGIWRWMAVN